ncbi:MAG: hypothetical protein EPO28_12220 [Saprospiraceae bacterium]|nr:MAG: hypothetical protein EPO28_12220 [Saprospiraceae bacterium]
MSYNTWALGKFDIKGGGMADDETVTIPHNPVLASIAAVYLVPTTSICDEAASISCSIPIL